MLFRSETSADGLNFILQKFAANKMHEHFYIVLHTKKPVKDSYTSIEAKDLPRLYCNICKDQPAPAHIAGAGIDPNLYNLLKDQQEMNRALFSEMAAIKESLIRPGTEEDEEEEETEEEYAKRRQDEVLGYIQLAKEASPWILGMIAEAKNIWKGNSQPVTQLAGTEEIGRAHV